MTKPLSNDLRHRLIATVDGGMTRPAAVERFRVAAVDGGEMGLSVAPNERCGTAISGQGQLLAPH